MTAIAATRLGGPASVAVGAVAAGALLLFRDPRTSTYLPCPLHAMTGLWCPGCGATRALGDLVRGDVASAMSANAIAVVLLFVGLAAWGVWVGARLRGRSFPTPPSRVVAAGVVVVVLFTVARNLPVGSLLAPN